MSVFKRKRMKQSLVVIVALFVCCLMMNGGGVLLLVDACIPTHPTSHAEQKNVDTGGGASIPTTRTPSSPSFPPLISGDASATASSTTSTVVASPSTTIDPGAVGSPSFTSINPRWDYMMRGLNGPDNWGGYCNAHGRRQSPIDLRSSIAARPARFEPIVFANYDATGPVQVSNAKPFAKVAGFGDWPSIPCISGGGLTGAFFLNSFHWHWASVDVDGSEHTLNGMHFPSEVHFVHVREGLTAEQANVDPNGYAVIGVFLTIGDNGAALAPLENALKSVQKNGTSTTLPSYSFGATLSSFPQNRATFYRYLGSLTTPACNEVVNWLIFDEPVEITAAQLHLLRSVEDEHGHPIDQNNRPLQPLDGRVVYHFSPP